MGMSHKQKLSAAALTIVASLVVPSAQAVMSATGASLWAIERTGAPSQSCQLALTQTPNLKTGSHDVEFQPGPTECFAGLGDVASWRAASDGSINLTTKAGDVRVHLIQRDGSLIDVKSGLTLTRVGESASY